MILFWVCNNFRKTPEQNMADFTSVLFALALVWVCKGVILCNGDFEDYGLVPDGNGQALQMVFSDPSCWYDSNYGLMFARIVNAGTSTAMEFTTGFPYILCQDVLLVAGNTYQLSFSVFNEQEVLSSNTRVSVNSVQLHDHAALNPLNFTSASFSFVADSAYTQVCFDLTFTLNIASGTVGPCIDNITIVDITPPVGPPANTTNTSPALNITNSTNPLNSTSNSSQVLNTTRSANSTNATTFDQTDSPSMGPNNNNELESKFELDDMVTWTVACIISYPIRLIAPLKDAYLFIDDLWLYDYNERNFTDLQETLFSTIAKIQLLKFEYLEKLLGWSKVKSFIRISDYRPFSAPRFVSVEGTSSVLLDSNFAFLIYTAPQNVLFSLALFFLFHLLKEHRVSKFIRKFYFLKTTLVLVLWESNFTYFLYVCFSHLRHPFCFNLADKVSAAFTVVFLCTLLLFGFCFYLLISEYLGKKASHFSEVTYRQSAGFWYKTLQLSIRNLLRAVVFCFFQHNYAHQLALLSLVECFVLVFSLFLQSKYKIFLCKATFSLNLSYPFLIIVWNTVLLMQANYPSESPIFQLLTQFEEAILYCLICNVLLLIVRDFLPTKCEKKQSKQSSTKNLKDNKKSLEETNPTKIRQKITIAPALSKQQIQILEIKSKQQNIFEQMQYNNGSIWKKKDDQQQNEVEIKRQQQNTIK